MEDDISEISLTTKAVFTTNSQKILIPQPPLFKYIPTVAAKGLYPPPLSPIATTCSSSAENTNNTPSSSSSQLTDKVTEELVSSTSTSSISSDSTTTTTISNSTTPATSPSPSSPSSSATITPSTVATTIAASISTTDSADSAIVITTTDLTTATLDSTTVITDSTIDTKDSITSSTTDLSLISKTESVNTIASESTTTITESITKDPILTTSYSENSTSDQMPTLIEKMNDKHCSSNGTLRITDAELSKKIKLDTLASKTAIITNKERLLLTPPLTPTKRSSKLPLRKSVSTPLSKSTETCDLLKKPSIPKIIKRTGNNDTKSTRKPKEGTKIPLPGTVQNEVDDDDEPAPKPISLKEKRARQAKRQDQVKFWRVREEREARQRRLLERKMIINRAEPSKQETVIKKGVKFNLKRNRVIEIPVEDDQTNA